MGGKYKLLPQIIPKFPDNIHTFVDLFGGGFNVGANVLSEHIIYNDSCKQVVELLQYFYEESTYLMLIDIKKIIEQYSLSKTNQNGYLKLREDYNKNPNPILFYVMLCYAFNYQIRFNSQGKYNMPFGKNRSSFNPVLEKKFSEFTTQIHSLNCSFSNISFEKFDFNSLCNNDFVYCDPPYLGSVAAYNEQNGWTEESEKTLLNLLDELNNKGVKWALSNNLKYNNPLLDNWREKYNTYYLNGDYSNCNYHKADKSKDIEVLITNYKPNEI